MSRAWCVVTWNLLLPTHWCVSHRKTQVVWCCAAGPAAHSKEQEAQPAKILMPRNMAIMMGQDLVHTVRACWHDFLCDTVLKMHQKPRRRKLSVGGCILWGHDEQRGLTLQKGESSYAQSSRGCFGRLDFLYLLPAPSLWYHKDDGQQMLTLLYVKYGMQLGLLGHMGVELECWPRCAAGSLLNRHFLL